MDKYKYNHGFIVMRAQPFHEGHKSLVNKMFKECKNITIILGSTQEERTTKNPFTFEERVQMLKNVYSKDPKFKRVQIFGLEDIPNDNEWYDYVLENIKEKCPNFGKVDAFYCGNDEDGCWFDDGKISIEKIERAQQGKEKLISGTEIREMIRNNNLKWKRHVSKENVEFLEGLIEKL